jgi:hypothetical protein
MDHVVLRVADDEHALRVAIGFVCVLAALRNLRASASTPRKMRAPPSSNAKPHGACARREQAHAPIAQAHAHFMMARRRS